jgi:hypothetical protein
MQSTYNNPPFRRQADKRTSAQRLAEAWAKLREQIADEHKSLRTHNSGSPRVKPTLATSIGFVVPR